MINRIKDLFRNDNHKFLKDLRERWAPLKPYEAYGDHQQLDTGHPDHDTFTFFVGAKDLPEIRRDVVRLTLTKKGHQVTKAIRYPSGNSVGAYDLFKEVR